MINVYMSFIRAASTSGKELVVELLSGSVNYTVTTHT